MLCWTSAQRVRIDRQRAFQPCYPRRKSPHQLRLTTAASSAFKPLIKRELVSHSVIGEQRAHCVHGRPEAPHVRVRIAVEVADDASERLTRRIAGPES